MPNDIKFCDFECEKVIAAFEKVFAIRNSQTLIDSYNTFKRNYLGEEAYVVAVDRQDIVLKNHEKLYDSDYWMGIDLPTLFSPSTIQWDNSYHKTIMIVAEDPLRPQNNEGLKPYKEKIILSTPFGLHIPEKRNDSNFIWRLIEKVSQVGYVVYTTDINKIWIKGNKSKEFFESSFFDECLLEEIKILSPSLIIGFGKFAEGALQRISNGKDTTWEVKTFPHPSGSNNKKWLKELSFEKCSVEHKATYVLEKLNLA